MTLRPAVGILHGMIRVVQILCIVVTAAILYGLWKAFMSLRLVFSAEFPLGFMAGLLFAVGIYLLITWIDPSSRPRGSGPKQD